MSTVVEFPAFRVVLPLLMALTARSSWHVTHGSSQKCAQYSHMQLSSRPPILRFIIARICCLLCCGVGVGGGGGE